MSTPFHAGPRRGVLVACALALLVSTSCAPGGAKLEMSDTVSIEALASELADSSAVRPALLHVGFAPLYRSGHIPGSQYAGPGNKASGIATLETALAAVPADRPVVLYCGCCPWQDCPNVRPAFQAARKAGRTNLRVLYVSSNLERDWIDRGLPAEKGGDTGAEP